MKKLIFVGLALGATAQAQIIGKSASFAESSFCDKYTCSLMARSNTAPGLVEYTYMVGKSTEDAPRDAEPPLYFVVRRLNNKIVSGRFSYEIQEQYLGHSPKDPIFSGFIKQLTGMSLNSSQLAKLEWTCGSSEKNTQAAPLPLGGPYIAECITYTTADAHMYEYNIYKK